MASEFEALPWIPSPTEFVATDRAEPARVHRLTPMLFALAWAVSLASTAYERSAFAGAFYPLTAVAVCLALAPLARRFRWRVDARTAQAAYRALTSLTPWLVFAWTVAPRFDVDGDSGGALGSAALVPSSFVLLPALPTTLSLLRRLPLSRARAWPVAVAALLVAGLALAAAGFSARHPTVDGLAAYTAHDATFDPARHPRRYVTQHDGASLQHRRFGERCVTRFVRDRARPAPSLSHRCASSVQVYTHPWELLPRRVFRRPRFTEMVFVASEGHVIGNKAAPRYLLYTAPLWEWIVCALLGASLGVYTLRRARAACARWRGLPVRGATAGDGVARCDDGAIVRLPDALSGHVGRVLVVGAPAPGAPFRARGEGEAIVVAADRGRWARALDGAESVAGSFALAVTLLPAAPLLASPLLGMLSPLR